VSEQGRIFREAWIIGVNKHYPGTPKDSYITPWEDTPETDSDIFEHIEDALRGGAQALSI
jgi:hypothetical protein